jgi:Mg-chelatase subunit ChlD
MIKTAGTNGALAVIVLDGSGSMQSCIDSTISGFNEFLQVQQQSEISTDICVYTFHGGSVQTIVPKQPAVGVTPLTPYEYRTHGMTNLLDAIGHAIHKTNAAILHSEDPPSVVMCIITDGVENSSIEYKQSQIKQLIAECEAANWTFMFLGANIDAFAVGNTLGLKQDSVLSYNTANMSSAMTSMAQATERVKYARAAGMDTSSVSASIFTTDDRDNNGL